jgi:hypothetical protein
MNLKMVTKQYFVLLYIFNTISVAFVTNLVKDENDDMLSTSHNTFNTWKKCFYQVLNAR